MGTGHLSSLDELGTAGHGSSCSHMHACKGSVRSAGLLPPFRSRPPGLPHSNWQAKLHACVERSVGLVPSFCRAVRCVRARTAKAYTNMYVQ